MDIVGAGTSPAAGWKAPASMVLVQLFNSGMILLSKVSINGGMFVFALLSYRSVFGAIFILPFALIFERYVLVFLIVLSYNRLNLCLTTSSYETYLKI